MQILKIIDNRLKLIEKIFEDKNLKVIFIIELFYFILYPELFIMEKIFIQSILSV
jgi:hypothetical protein